MISNLISRRNPSAVASATSGSCTALTPTRLKTSQTYYHRNQQYSIVGLTNAAGTLVERYTYGAYGTLGIYAANGTVRSSSTYANRYTYTGREWDADLRLYHFRARWYDPATGGFVSRDPLGYVDGMGLYRRYFGVRGVDPSGLYPWNDPLGWFKGWYSGLSFDDVLGVLIDAVKHAIGKKHRFGDGHIGFFPTLSLSASGECCCEGVSGTLFRLLTGVGYGSPMFSIAFSAGGEPCASDSDFSRNCGQFCIAGTGTWSVTGTLFSMLPGLGPAVAFIASASINQTFSIQCGACGSSIAGLYDNFGCALCKNFLAFGPAAGQCITLFGEYNGYRR